MSLVLLSHMGSLSTCYSYSLVSVVVLQSTKKRKGAQSLCLVWVYEFCSIMDVISIAFLLFVEESRTSVITFTSLYVSLLVFLVLFISYSLYTLFRGRNPDVMFFRQFLNYCGSIFMFLTAFPAVMLLVVMYMVIVFSLNLTGVTGILTGLIPSLVLSAGSWYIKKRLEKELSQSSTATEPGTAGGAVNDGEREEIKDSADDERMLLP